MEGVLLFYKYVIIDELEEVREHMSELCNRLLLKGRVRISPEGINATVGGAMKALQEYMDELERHTLFQGCDFKLGQCHGPALPALSTECGFDSLSVRVVKEVVTLGPFAGDVEKHPTGLHVSPTEFHELLLGAKAFPKDPRTLREENEGCSNIAARPSEELIGHVGDGEGKREPEEGSRGMVVIDARNLYETRVGRFNPPEDVEWLDPRVRQFSDLPPWLDDIAPAIRGKRILMYCTGGVRCERASAYLRGKGEGFQDVYQLSGGIHRYLEQYPDGGFFLGKNFVFDPRVTVSSGNAEVVGRCLVCGMSHDDYSARSRCDTCRMLILVCHTCQVNKTGDRPNLCELCQDTPRNVNNTGQTSKCQDLPHIQAGCHVSANVNIKGQVCRPDAGSVSDLREEGVEVGSEVGGQGIEQEAEQGNREEGHGRADVAQGCCGQAHGGDRWQPRVSGRKLRILCLHGFRQSASSLQGRTAALRKRLRHVADLVYIDGPHVIPMPPVAPTCCATDTVPEIKQAAKPRYAWLVETPSKEEEGSEGTSGGGVFDADQYSRQTEGWELTRGYLERVVREKGPFDGIMGFSQGAAVAAAFCAATTLTTTKTQDLHSSSQRCRDGGSAETQGTRFETSSCRSRNAIRFAILASGFVSPAREHQGLLSNAPIALPSLHIFGQVPNQDRQIAMNESHKLMQTFDPHVRHLVSHTYGHIIPSNVHYARQYISFLNQFSV